MRWIFLVIAFAACKKDEPAKAATPAPAPPDAAAAARPLPPPDGAPPIASPADAATAAVTPPDAGAAAPAPPARKTLKAIKVLPRDWSYERVETFMKDEVAAGLGVKCSFCHDEKDHAKDTKHKVEAREMMELTRDLNAAHFGGKTRVRCVTCHNGREEPRK
jgi:hypothetical protein